MLNTKTIFGIFSINNHSFNGYMAIYETKLWQIYIMNIYNSFINEILNDINNGNTHQTHHIHALYYRILFINVTFLASCG